jgi:protein gp37
VTNWKQPLRWNRAAEKDGVRRRVFCASLADVFEDHPDLPAARADLWPLAEACSSLDWMLLTKRPENILSTVPSAWLTSWPAHVWVGTTAEDQPSADRRTRELYRVPARVRFLSCEPLLGPVDITNGECNRWSCPTRTVQGVPVEWSDPGPDFIPVDLVIVGGESGSHARPMHPGWVRWLRDQCLKSGTAFFFKQWGEWAPAGSEPRHGDVWHLGHNADNKPWTQPWAPDSKGASPGRWDRFGDELMRRVGKVAAGDVLDGRTWTEMP